MKKAMRLLAGLTATVVMAAGLAACGASGGAASTEAFPQQDITFLVPYSAGGSSDQMARVISNYAPQYFGVNIVIENVPGGGGNIGLNELAQKKPDG
ncbi:MAG: hypothetical protein ACK5L3_03990 [Oscillospiraceae bacterium]